jgi:hypothetical protein
MPGAISTLAEGLLGLLDMKSVGRLPSQLLDGVQPQIDLTQFYFNRQSFATKALFGSTSQPSTAAITGRGQFPFTNPSQIVVPANQLWWVHEMTGTVSTTVAADTGTFALGYSLGYDWEPFACGPTYTDPVNANQRLIQLRLDKPFFVGPGGSFFVLSLACASAGGLAFSLGMRAVVMQF